MIEGSSVMAYWFGPNRFLIGSLEFGEDQEIPDAADRMLSPAAQTP